MKKPVLLLVLVLLALIAWRLYSISAKRSDPGKRSRPQAAVAVELQPVERRTLRDVRTLTGSLAPRSQFILAPKMAGRLEEVRVEIGDAVTNGSLIARLDDQEYRQQAEQARAEWEVAKAQVLDADSALDVASRDFDRTRELLNQKVASEAETEQARAKFLAAQARQAVVNAQVRQAEAALRGAEIRLSYTRIAAGWEGADGVRYVGERFADEGAMLKANDPIVSLLDLRTLVGVIFVIERDYAGIHPGQPAVITTDARPGQSFSGRIVRKAPLLKEESRQARVEIEVPNPGLLLAPGMFMRAEIELAVRTDVQSVPSSSLVQRGGETGIFLVESGADAARFVPVTIGLVSGPWTEIASPLLQGRVVTLGQHLLEDGSAVQLPGEAGKPGGAKRGNDGPRP